MKIAVANTFLPSEQASGVPFQVHGLANALSAHGHDVTVFSFSPLPAGALYALHRFPRPRVPARLLAFVMAYRLATTDFSAFDVINVHGDNYLLRSTRPIVRTFYGTALDEFKHAKTWRRRMWCLLQIPLERIGATLADYVVGCSETTRAQMPAVEEVIPCGIDVETFGAGLKTERPTVLFVGTEGGRKRGAWLAETFKRHILPVLPDAELRMVTDSTVVEPGVRRYGRVTPDALVELYRSAWVFCLPSTYEGFGVPYIEAMAAHTAVVATSPNPGAREVLAGGAFGLYVDDAELGTALTRVLSDAALRDDLVRRGLERSRAFAWTAIVARYQSAFAKATLAKGVRKTMAA